MHPGRVHLGAKLRPLLRRENVEQLRAHGLARLRIFRAPFRMRGAKRRHDLTHLRSLLPAQVQATQGMAHRRPVATLWRSDGCPLLA